MPMPRLIEKRSDFLRARFRMMFSTIYARMFCAMLTSVAVFYDYCCIARTSESWYCEKSA